MNKSHYYKFICILIALKNFFRYKDKVNSIYMYFP
jgi:hypothetical protein